MVTSSTLYRFAPASEDEALVFGAARPGYRHEQVTQWVEYMQGQGIQRVCCLLPTAHLGRYSGLLGGYQKSFGDEQVCWAPIADFHLATPDLLFDRILPFLTQANQFQEKTVVHCSGGVGRTGHVLAAWLMAGRGLPQEIAIAAVKQAGRNPYEAVIAAPFKGRNPWQVAAELHELLDACSRFNLKKLDGETC